VDEYRTRRRIEFSDTDAGGIAHFARFFVFMEGAEHELLRALGANPGAERADGGPLIGWPRVAASCEFLSPVRFGDELEIHVRVLRVGRTSLSFGFAMSHDGRPVARGRTTTVCAVLDAPEGIQPIPIPAALRAQLEAAPEGGAGDGSRAGEASDAGDARDAGDASAVAPISPARSAEPA
jgi:acyl-CoA thioester hydrolase